MTELREIEYQIKSDSDNLDHVSYRIMTRNGEVKQIEDYGRKAFIPGIGEVYIVFFVDTESKYLSHDIDQLTGLPGKKRFWEFASKTLKSDNSSEMIFLYFNICKFKMINVKYGMERGDAILRDIAMLLKEEFSDSNICRFSDDHFVILTRNIDIERRIEKLYNKLLKIHDNVKIDGKVGMLVVKDNNINPELACDYAKLACDSIRNKPNTFIAYYTDELRKQIDAQYYVVNNLDKAIDNGYIKVYYQPVVRSISKSLCGMEALARWIDPEKGFISPGEFIPALENSHLIHKLDSFIIREICRQYRECVDKGIPVVPISFNLSRLDFFLTNIGEIIEKTIEEFRVPRQMLNIEITESVFVEYADKIDKEINTFRAAGFKVWMDDFGSGYSSLNILKDFSFDELKIDMAFLSSFTEKAKSILKSTIHMAKDIDIQTLAEGVETEEQYQFLRAIGCEKIQGYYFGKPVPYIESLNNCIAQNMQVENIAWSDYYDKVGKINFMDERPMAIATDDGSEIKILFANKNFLESLKSNGTKSFEEAERNMNAPGSPMQRMMRSIADKLIKNGKSEEITYPSGNQYMLLRGQNIASCNGHYMYVANLTNITRNADKDNQAEYDTMIRNILYLYDVIAVVDFAKDTTKYFNVIQGETGVEIKKESKGIKRLTQEYYEEKIYPDDVEEYKEFTNPENLRERIENSEHGYVSEYFRTKDLEGNYLWAVHTMMVIPKTNYQKFIIVTRSAPIDDEEVRRRLQDIFKNEYAVDAIEDAEKTVNIENTQKDTIKSEEKKIINKDSFSSRTLWHNIRDYSSIKYFWKDKDRRFVGANKSFLEYYGLESIQDIIGKTDEEMQWHVCEEPYKSDEELVISEGKHIVDAPGKCLIKWVIHNILATKMPIYQDGKIVGLIGYFIEAERDESRQKKVAEVSTVDFVTNMANTRGIMENFVSYIEEYKLRDKNFVALAIQIDGYEDIRKDYGDEAGDDLLRKIANIILDNFGTKATIGRLQGAHFITIYQNPNKEEIDRIIEKIRYEIKHINHIGDKKCTCFPNISIDYVANSNNYDKMMLSLLRLGKKNRLGIQENHINVIERMTS